MRKPLPAIHTQDVVFGGHVRLFRNPADRIFSDKDAFRFETKWRNFESIQSAFQLAQDKSDEMAKRQPFAWDPAFGYLSPIPTHCGAGLEVDGLFHLEGLHLIGDLPPVLDALEAVRISAHGVDADGLHHVGHLFTLASNASFGCPDESIMKRVFYAFSDLILQERQARMRLIRELPRVLSDSFTRALAILRHCRLLSKWELLDILSPIRLACTLGYIEGLTLAEADDYILDQFLHGNIEDIPDTIDAETARDRRDAELADRINERFKTVQISKRGKDLK